MSPDVKRFFRKTEPDEGTVPRGAKPGGVWMKRVEVRPGTVRSHVVGVKWEYLPPAGDGDFELWPSELKPGPTLRVPKVTDYREILGGKMRAAGEKE